MDGATKQALLAVVQVWLDRLQTMAVIVRVVSQYKTIQYAYRDHLADYVLCIY